MTAPPVVFTRATLSAGENSTEYLRAGAGGSVLLLISGGVESALSLRLIGALARGSRVIAPSGLTTGPAFASVLERFLEGLGVVTTAIVAEGAYCAPALDYITAAACGVSRVALLVPDAEVRRVRDAAARRLARSGAALLVRAAGSTADADALDILSHELAAFLG